MNPHCQEVDDSRFIVVAQTDHESSRHTVCFKKQGDAGRKPPTPVSLRPGQFPFVRGSESVWRIGKRFQSASTEARLVPSGGPTNRKCHHRILTAI